MGVLIALRVRLGRGEERGIVALVEARSATGLRVCHGVLDGRDVAVPALLVSEGHGGAVPRVRRLRRGWEKVTMNKVVDRMGSTYSP